MRNVGRHLHGRAPGGAGIDERQLILDRSQPSRRTGLLSRQLASWRAILQPIKNKDCPDVGN
ncbi:hypothetical protein MASSI9I_20614 [Massilia sp. 9I]|nr:hypothetical protein MASSI9I_20614 [Massilia sp. 9I]